MKSKYSVVLIILLFCSCSSDRQKFLSSEMFNLNGRPYKVSFTGYGRVYNDEGNLEWKYPALVPKYGYVYEFKPSGQLVKICYYFDGTNYYGQEKKKSKCLSFEYQEEGQLTIKTISPDGEATDSTIVDLNTVKLPSIAHLPIFYTEDRYHNWNLAEELTEHLNERTKFSKYKTNQKGFIVRREVRDDLLGEYPDIEYVYNHQNDLQNIVENWGDTLVYTTDSLVYNYDDQGNWLEQTHFNVYGNGNTNLWSMVERKIEYYCPLEFDDISLVGLWKEKDSNNWIEFMPDNTYDWGRNSEIRHSGSWSMNKSSKRLTLRSSKGGEKYRVTYIGDDCRMLLSELMKEGEGDVFIRSK